jgi:phenylacetate-CoA ligase
MGENRPEADIAEKSLETGRGYQVIASIREITKLRGEVELVAPGSLPNHGKVIEDLRKYG